MEFFRFCPECGRRFHIKLVSKKLIKLDRETISRPRAVHMGGSTGRAGPYSGPNQPMTMVYEGEPIIIDLEEFQYNYKCKHCGHEWSEKRTEQHKEE